MSWLKSILAILGSLFKVIDKKTLSYEEKVDKINRDKKEQIKDDWKDTQNEIDRAFRAAKSRNRMQDGKSEQ